MGQLTEHKTVSLADAAFILRERLGGCRNWSKFLYQINTMKFTHFNGLSLYPIAEQHDGKSFRPRYSMTHIDEFVRLSLLIDPTLGAEPVKETTLKIDSFGWWKNKRFDRLGNAITTH